MDDALKAATHPHDFKLLVSSDGQRHTSVESVFRDDDQQPAVSGAARTTRSLTSHAALVADVARAQHDARIAPPEVGLDAERLAQAGDGARPAGAPCAARPRTRCGVLAEQLQDQLGQEPLAGALEAVAAQHQRAPAGPHVRGHRDPDGDRAAAAAGDGAA